MNYKTKWTTKWVKTLDSKFVEYGSKDWIPHIIRQLDYPVLKAYLYLPVFKGDVAHPSPYSHKMIIHKIIALLLPL